MEGNKSLQKPVKIGKISKSSIIVDGKLLEGSKSSLKIFSARQWYKKS